MIIILSILLGLMVLFASYANWVYWRDYRKMTPDERRRFNEETNTELQIW